MMAHEPKRIQRRRTKGWKMPEGAIYVGRPSKWGNPYSWQANRKYVWTVVSEPLDEPIVVSDYERRRFSVIDFEDMLNRAPLGDGTWGREGETVFETIRRELAGKDLACWCPLDQPCHADVLLAIANRGE